MAEEVRVIEEIEAPAEEVWRLLGDFGGGKFKNTFGSSNSNVDVSAEFTAATDERPALLFVTASVAEGYHIYAVDQGTLPGGST